MKSRIVILLIIGILIRAGTVASQECRNCEALSKARYIGIKPVKEYLSRPGEIVKYANAKRAERAMLTKFTGCSTPNTSAARTACRPVFGVPAASVYFCPRQLRPFNSLRAAQRAKFLPYTACGVNAPIPGSLAFIEEEGVRFSDLDAFTVVADPNSGYRMYYATSVSSLQGDTLRYTNSQDGIVFEQGSAITGIAPSSSETLAYPTVLYSSGRAEFISFYVSIRHISSSGVDVSSIYRATSADGTHFTRAPDTIAFPDGSSLATVFMSSVVATGEESIRLYYLSASDLMTRASSTLGSSFDEPQVVTIRGKSSALAPFPSTPAVIRTESGKYFLFFSSPLNEDSATTSIFYAESSDGFTFQLFEEPLLTGTPSVSFQAPVPVLLPDDSIRLYYIERSGALSAPLRSVKSLRSTTAASLNGPALNL